MVNVLRNARVVVRKELHISGMIANVSVAVRHVMKIIIGMVANVSVAGKYVMKGMIGMGANVSVVEKI
jgi:hypothetical protein